MGRSVGDETLLSDPMYQLGGMLWGQGDLDGAERCWRRALTLPWKISDARGWVGTGLNSLFAVVVARSAPEYRTLRDDLRGTRHARSPGDQPSESDRVVPQMGLLKKALTLADHTIRRSEEVQHPHGVALARFGHRACVRCFDSTKRRRRRLRWRSSALWRLTKTRCCAY